MAQARAHAKQAEPELDLNHLAQLIRTGRAAPELMESWLDATWREPARFKHSLYRAAAVRGSEAIKSRPELGLDLYADCVASHLGHQRAALTLVQHGGAPQETSYEALHARSGALASAWHKSGVKAGDKLALLLPVGLDYAVALLAALRLGLCISPIPPLGASYARNRLLLAAADHIATSARLVHMLPPGSAPPLPLTAAGADSTRAASHAYAPTDCALRLFSPFGPSGALCELDALTLHESLLRDGLLVLALTTADRVAAPGWDELQLQPLLLLTTWLAGATWVECTAADFAAQSLGISVLGVDTHLRELIRARGGESCRGV
jgi:non-ribosomal peptide synthetase component F